MVDRWQISKKGKTIFQLRNVEWHSMRIIFFHSNSFSPVTDNRLKKRVNAARLTASLEIDWPIHLHHENSFLFLGYNTTVTDDPRENPIKQMTFINNAQVLFRKEKEQGIRHRGVVQNKS
jgi:hypothetical protein